MEHVGAILGLTFLGSALGGAGRFLLAGLIDARHGHHLPLGTMVVNVSGAFLIGWLWGKLSSEALIPFLLLGVLGGFTTVSSFSLQTLHLWRDGHRWSAGLHVGASVMLCLAAVAAGVWVRA